MPDTDPAPAIGPAAIATDLLTSVSHPPSMTDTHLRECANVGSVVRVTAAVPLLAAAGGIGLAHSVLPDHWLPLAVTARARRDPLPRVARLSLLAGTAHVAVSVVLGGMIIAVGLSLRSVIESRTNLIVGALLVLTGWRSLSPK